MHHKRGKAKAQRAGCLFCKPHKFGHGMENDLGFTPYRKEVAMKKDLPRDLDELDWPLVWAGEEWGYV